MQPILTNVNMLMGLGLATVASIAVLLYVSIERNFLPGVVELSTALVVALIFGIIALIPRESRRVIKRRLSNVRSDRLRFVAAGVAVLAITAVLALFNENFPWPAPLILVLVLMVFAVRDTDTAR